MILIWNPITQIFHFSWVLDPTRGFKPTWKTEATKSHLIIFPVLPFQWRLIAVDWLGFLPWVPNAARWLWGHLQRWIPNKPLKKTRKRVRRGSAWGFFVFFRRWFSGKEWNNGKTPGFRKKQKKRMRKKMLCAQILFYFQSWGLRVLMLLCLFLQKHSWQTCRGTLWPLLCDQGGEFSQSRCSSCIAGVRDRDCSNSRIAPLWWEQRNAHMLRAGWCAARRLRSKRHINCCICTDDDTSGFTDLHHEIPNSTTDQDQSRRDCWVVFSNIFKIFTPTWGDGPVWQA